MRRTKTLLTALICLVALITSALCSCQPEPENEEVENGSVWQFSSIGSVEPVEGKSQSAAESRAATVKSYYTVIYGANGGQTKSDVIGFKDGKVLKLHFGGTGNPSYYNGIPVYSSYEPYEYEFGSYSGSEISIVDYNEEITEAYIRDGVLTLIHEDYTARIELLFTKTSDIGLFE